MCGIAGHVGMHAPGLLGRMLEALRHRGPDDAGAHETPAAGIGMTRLAIIDLAGGRQPMTNEDGSLWIVFNGEIYNHRELRRDLEAAGHRFRTRSDTEAILHLYEQDGASCVRRLRGMFAFAIWDARDASLFLARDRLGKKPLYFWRRHGGLLFASEIKALLCHPEVARELDPDAFRHYLAFGYTPAERSVFAGIGKLPPAHTAVFRNGELTATRYWRLPVADGAPSPPPAEAASRLRAAVREAVALRLESDVPLGVFLSGGVDSSVVVACMREATDQRIATFCIGFGAAASSFDERPMARLVARRFGTEHTEEILEPRVADLLPALVEHFDEPFADSSAIPTFVVAQATARHVKVALSGIGGDEACAGYPRYLGVRVSERYRRVPRPLRAAMAAALRRAVPDRERSRNWADWIRRFTAGVELPLPDRYIAWTRFFDDDALARLASPALRALWDGPADAGQQAAYAGLGFGDPMDGAFRIDLDGYLPGDLLVMADRMSMAHSLELRAPFCDHRLIEESLRIAPGTKLPGFRLKGLLKAAFADRLPREILSGRKQGFMIPLGQWLRTDLRAVMDDLLTPDRIRARGLFSPEAVRVLQHEHLAGIRTHADRLWTLMMAELWMRRYLDGAGLWRLTGC